MILEPSQRPVFSIVAPTFRRPRALCALLTGIDALRFPHGRMEVIIVDDSGGPLLELEPVLAAFRDRFPLISVCTPHVGPAAARQTGIDAARGTYLAFTDDDCVPDPDWLTELQAGLDANPGCAIGGAVINGLPQDRFAAVWQIIYDYIVIHSANDGIAYVGTGNVAFPAEGFRAIGGLDRSWQLWGGEDRDLSRRWRASGRRFLLRPSAMVRHYHALTLVQFWRQHFRYGRGSSRFHRTTGYPRPGFYAGLLAAGFRAGGLWHGWLTGALLLLSQVAIFCGFLAERLSRRRS